MSEGEVTKNLYKNQKQNKFTTYDCPGKSYKGEIGFAQVDGNGIVLLFSK